MNIDYLKENGICVDKAIELLGDMDTYSELLRDFYDAIDERLEKITNFLESKDWKNYTIEVHSLKSDSKYLGFESLADMALEHQTRGEQQDENYILEHYEELKKEIIRIQSVLKKCLEG